MALSLLCLFEEVFDLTVIHHKSLLMVTVQSLCCIQGGALFFEFIFALWNETVMIDVECVEQIDSLDLLHLVKRLRKIVNVSLVFF